jgi:hypothetical protein
MNFFKKILKTIALESIKYIFCHPYIVYGLPLMISIFTLYFQIWLISHPYLIYFLIITPFLLLARVFHFAINTLKKEEDLKKQIDSLNFQKLRLNSRIDELTVLIPYFNVYWDKQVNPFSLCCRAPLKHHLFQRLGAHSLGEALICTKCKEQYFLYTPDRKRISFEEAKEFINDVLSEHTKELSP